MLSAQLHGQTLKEVKKTEDGRYITQISATPNALSQTEDARIGLVKKVTLGVEWWMLLGEPIEKYLFRWERGSSVFSPKNNIWISENNLKKYPDLLKRYNSLKPEYMVLKISVSFNLSNQKALLDELPRCMKTSKSLGVAYNYVNGTRTVNSNGHFFIVKSGATGDELSPSSPKDWTEFIRYTCQNENNSSKQVFKLSQSATFFLEVIEIKPPLTAINQIAGEYLKREKKEKEPKKDDDKKDDDQKTQEKKEQENRKNNNNWDLDQNNSSSADPWGSSSQNTQSKNVQKQNKVRGSNNWNMDSKSENQSTSSTEGNDWGKTNSDDQSTEYSIQWKDGKYGVINPKTKAILFPYIDGQILEYKPTEKMARVFLRKSHRNINVSCDKDGSVSVEEGLEGYMDADKNWLIEPQKVANISSHYDYWNGLLLLHPGDDADAIKKRIKARDKKCGGKVREAYRETVSSYKSRGYIVK